MSDSSEHSTPLLRSRPGADAGENSGLQSPATLAVLLGRAVGRRGPSFLVRETAAREIEARRADWGYSTPVVSVDMLWNMAFVVASVVMLVLTVDENPNVPLRLWIGGYALQCFMHVVLVWLEYRRRTRVSRSASMRGDRSRLGGGDEETGGARVQHPYEINESDEGDDGAIGMFGLPSRTSFTKRCESVNTMASFLWWIVGFYWVVSGGEQLLHNAPRLYWLTLVFLAFDVFFAIFCVVLACLIGIALCCCLPCIIAVLYSVAGQGGASDAELGILPKYIFNSSVCEGNSSVGAGVMVPVDNGSGYVATERTLLPEDAECCICLSSYEDGVELHALPCNHHFHSTCIVKWLKMNATCPLCKYDILKADEQV